MDPLKRHHLSGMQELGVCPKPGESSGCAAKTLGCSVERGK
jgi:hypothetical protein